VTNIYIYIDQTETVQTNIDSIQVNVDNIRKMAIFETIKQTLFKYRLLITYLLIFLLLITNTILLLIPNEKTVNNSLSPTLAKENIRTIRNKTFLYALRKYGCIMPTYDKYKNAMNNCLRYSPSKIYKTIELCYLQESNSFSLVIHFTKNIVQSLNEFTDENLPCQLKLLTRKLKNDRTYNEMIKMYMTYSN